MSVGAGDTILATTNGSTWSAQASGTTSALNAVSCPSTSTCYAAGASGTILATASEGSAWGRQTSGSTASLGALSCPVSTYCYAVGAVGAILGTANSGASWSTMSSGTTANLNAVSLPAGQYQGVIAGDLGPSEALSCSGGSLGLSGPASLSFSTIALNGLDEASTATATLNPDDETGSAAGWNISAYATSFTDSAGHALANPTVTTASGSALVGVCSLPTNSVTNPTLALGTGSASATKLYDAGLSSGAGPASLALTLSLHVPANQLLGAKQAQDTYSSTVTFTISTGP